MHPNIETLRTSKSNLIGAAIKISMMEILLRSTLLPTERGHLAGSPQFYKENEARIVDLIPVVRPAVIALLIEAGELEADPLADDQAA